MAKLANSLVIFALLVGIINCQYGGNTPTFKKAAPVRTLFRDQPITTTTTTTTELPEDLSQFDDDSSLFDQQQQVDNSYSSYSQQVDTSFDEQQTVEVQQPVQQPVQYGGAQPSLRKLPVSVPVQRPIAKDLLVSKISYGAPLPVTTTTTTTTTPAPVRRLMPLQREKTLLQTPSGYSSQSTVQKESSSMRLKPVQRPSPQRDQIIITPTPVDPCTTTPCQNGGLCTRVTDTTFTCTCTEYFFGETCQYRKQTQPAKRPVQQTLPLQTPTYGSSMLPSETPLLQESSVSSPNMIYRSCEDNPCENEGTCTSTGTAGFTCTCPWGWIGKRCEICVTDCASNPCPSNKKCRAKYSGGYECICPADRSGPNCEIQRDACANLPCLNGGLCKPNGDSFTCTCTNPWAGDRCEAEFVNPCSVEVMRESEVLGFPYPWDRTKYIVCTTETDWVLMTCSTGTLFSSSARHCLPEGYEAPICPPNTCFNDGECFKSQTEEWECHCKPGYTGRFCDVNIDECALFGSRCGRGQCVDQVNAYYCDMLDGTFGLDTANLIENPCTPQALLAGKVYFGLDGANGEYYVHCKEEFGFEVRKCADNLFWDSEKETCVIEKPATLTGACTDAPCKNGGKCTSVSANQFTCTCATGYTGDLCETAIDYCSSNPCMNGGRCLSYTGGYTCVCPDKIIDDCCCNGIINPCPTKDKIVPGVNNYFPHIFPNKYIHCDFDGRAFVRTCGHGSIWMQEHLACAARNFSLTSSDDSSLLALETPQVALQQDLLPQQFVPAPAQSSYTMQTQQIKKVQTIQKDLPKQTYTSQTITTIQKQVPIAAPKPVPSKKVLPIQKDIITTPIEKPLETSYGTLPTVQRPISVQRPIPVQQTLPIQTPTYGTADESETFFNGDDDSSLMQDTLPSEISYSQELPKISSSSSRLVVPTPTQTQSRIVSVPQQQQRMMTPTVVRTQPIQAARPVQTGRTLAQQQYRKF